MFLQPTADSRKRNALSELVLDHQLHLSRRSAALTNLKNLVYVSVEHRCAMSHCAVSRLQQLRFFKCRIRIKIAFVWFRRSCHIQKKSLIGVMYA